MAQNPVNEKATEHRDQILDMLPDQLLEGLSIEGKDRVNRDNQYIYRDEYADATTSLIIEIRFDSGNRDATITSMGVFYRTWTKFQSYNSESANEVDVESQTLEGLEQKLWMAEWPALQ